MLHNIWYCPHLCPVLLVEPKGINVELELVILGSMHEPRIGARQLGIHQAPVGEIYEQGKPIEQTHL